MREPEDGHRVIANLSRLWPLLGRCIAFHRRLVDLTGSVKASLMLSQAIYWTRRGKDIRQRDGWFFKTIEQWQYETGLSRHEQANARAILRGLDLLEERRHGLPAKPVFRVDGDRLATLLADPNARRVEPIDWDDNAQLCDLLGPVLSFHRCLSSITGNVIAGLLLSRAVYFTRINSRVRRDGRFSRSTAQWQDDTGLTWREQAGARKVLRDLGIIEETLKGVPPQVLLRINLERLIELLSQPLKAGQSEALNLPPSGKPAGGNATYRYCANRQTRMWESHNLILRKAADKTAGKRNNSQPVYAKLYVQKLITRSMSTKPLPPTSSQAATVDHVENDRGGGDLIFPTALLPQEQTAASALVRGCRSSRRPCSMSWLGAWA